MYRKGADMERQLKGKLEHMGLGCLRVAGSAGPDIVSSINGHPVFFECKYTSKERVYVPREEVERELALARKMGATFYLALKFGREAWRIAGPERLEKFSRGKSYLVRLPDLAGLPKLTTILDKDLNGYDK